MTNKNVSRRDFLASGSLLSAAGLLRVSGASLALLAENAVAARDEARSFTLLSPHQATQLEAIAARIIPTTDTPGAREAGVVYFYDGALDGPMAGLRPVILDGLANFEASLKLDQDTRFSDLEPEDQDSRLKAQEDSPFFSMLDMLTQFGFFAMAKHGGNRDHLSWKLIGFEGHGGAHVYPFGYYDAELHGSGDND